MCASPEPFCCFTGERPLGSPTMLLLLGGIGGLAAAADGVLLRSCTDGGSGVSWKKMWV